jgi:hypothetical protein
MNIVGRLLGNLCKYWKYKYTRKYKYGIIAAENSTISMLVLNSHRITHGTEPFKSPIVQLFKNFPAFYGT